MRFGRNDSICTTRQKRIPLHVHHHRCLFQVRMGHPGEEKDRQRCYAMVMVLRGHRLPKHLQTDQGKEVININFQKLLKRYGIKHYSTFSTLKASVVERFNHTLKDSMWREFSFILQKIISVFFPPTLFLGSFKVQSHYLFTI